MNNARRNVVIVGISEENKEKYKDKFIDYCINKRFPHYIFVDKPDDVKRLEGFAIVLFYSSITDYHEFDRLNRRKYKKFDHIIVFLEYPQIESLEMSNIIFMSMKSLYYIRRTIELLYESSITKEKRILSKTKRDNIEKLKNFVKGKKVVTNKEVCDGLGVSRKWVVRYMHEMNNVYKNVATDGKHPIKWYII